jgi:hypothetical protein
LPTPWLNAKRGKKAVKAPQTMVVKKTIIDGGRAFRLRKKLSSMDELSDGATCLFPNLWVMNREHNDRPVQARKRWVKLKWLIRNIPKGGAKALEKLKAR